MQVSNSAILQPDNSGAFRLDTATLTALGIGQETECQPETCRELTGHGEQGQTLTDDGVIQTELSGDWLQRFAENADSGTIERMALLKGDLIEAYRHNSTVHLRRLTTEQPQPSLRHDLSNHLNAIMVNAELVSLLAQRNNESKILDASKRILDTCQKAVAFSRQELTTALMSCPDQVNVTTTLEALLNAPAAFEPVDREIAIDLSAAADMLLPDTWLHVIAEFLKRIGKHQPIAPQKSGDHEPNGETTRHLQTTPQAEQRALSICIDLGDVVDSQHAETVVDREWRLTESIAQGLSALPSAAGPWRLSAYSDSLQLTAFGVS